MKSALPLLLASLLLCGCEKTISGRLPQRAYLWQRDWTPAVGKALFEAEDRLDAIILLGGEIVWREGTPHFLKSSIAWESLGAKPTGIALRVARFDGAFDEEKIRFISAAAQKLLRKASEHEVRISEFQLDYDCPQKKLGNYRAFLHSLGQVIRPTRFAITTLPSWLDEPEFVRLLSEVDGYVLQVHSVPAIGKNENAVLCDPQMAKAWVKKAARIGREFSVALPTYRCLGGYDADGKLLGVAMDSVQPAWPRGTRVLEFSANADELARLIAEWQRARPAQLQDVIWYRVPIETDKRNWRWPTLAAVMKGRAPARNLEVATTGDNPADVLLINNGEADEQFVGEISVQWNDAQLVSSDALAQMNLHTENKRAVFQITEPLRLSPGERRVIGWLRYDQPAELQLALHPTTR